MLGAGRPAKKPSIDSVRELTREEVATIPRARTAAVVQLRDTHHMLARLVAMGLRNGDISLRTGYSLVRISIMKGDPAFQQLVASYRESVDDQWRESVDEYFENAAFVRTASIRQIRDRLEDADETGEKIPLNQLLALHADTADRTGYPKRKEALNINMDFAGQLEKAVRRSAEAMRTIEHNPAEALPTSSPTADPSDSSDGAGQGAEPAQGKRLDAPNPGPVSRLERRA